MDAKDFLSLKYNKEKFTKKIETNYFESGRNGISNQLIKRGFKLLIINSDNNKFNINDWKKSETYCLSNQSKLIFKDNRTEEYENADYFEKNKRIKFCWGDI